MLGKGKVGSELEERKRIESMWWAGVLIWAGLVFAADSLGILPQVGEAGSWSWVFFGAGLGGMLGNLYRVVSENLPNPATWDYIFTGFLLLVGLGGISAVDIFWPVVLIIVGAVTLVSTSRQRG
jgi:hypothetical protein